MDAEALKAMIGGIYGGDWVKYLNEVFERLGLNIGREDIPELVKKGEIYEIIKERLPQDYQKQLEGLLGRVELVARACCDSFLTRGGSMFLSEIYCDIVNRSGIVIGKNSLGIKELKILKEIRNLKKYYHQKYGQEPEDLDKKIRKIISEKTEDYFKNEHQSI